MSLYYLWIMYKKFHYLLFLPILFGIQSCEKESAVSTQIAVSKGVLVLNEGNFMGGNATVTYRDLISGELSSDLFQGNNGFYLGDVGQSLLQLDGKIYLVVNNSGKIEVLNSSDFKSVMTIQGLNSPRYLLKVGTDKAYVTDLYAKKITILKLSTGTKIGEIPLPYWTEELLLLNGKVYIGTVENDKVYLVDPVSDAITDSIQTAFSPGSLAADKEGNLWVLCYGSETASQNGSVYKITAPGNSASLLHNFQVPLPYGSMLTTNRLSDSLFVLASDVYGFPISNPNFSSPIVERNGRNLTAIGYDSNSFRLYVADSKDFNQKGEIFVHKPEGVAVDSFLAGVIPGMFLFVE